MFADIDHGFCFKPLYHIGVSKNISITFLREKGNGRTMQLVAVIYFRILSSAAQAIPSAIVMIRSKDEPFE